MNNYNDEIWVFLSHSHEDYENVLKVRDLLEQDSYRPIMFFLRCLENDDEVDVLIKREIDARKRFILCDSENARKSKWVQREVEYIKSKDRLYETVNLDASIEEIAQSLKNFKRRSTVYIRAYSNVSFSNKLYEALKKEEYRIFNKREEINAVRQKFDSIKEKDYENAFSPSFNAIWIENDLFWHYFWWRTSLLSQNKELADENKQELDLLLSRMKLRYTQEEIEDTMLKVEERYNLMVQEREEIDSVEKIAEGYFQQSQEEGYVIHLIGKKEWLPKNLKRMERLFGNIKENSIYVALDQAPNTISKGLQNLIDKNPPLEVYRFTETEAIEKIIHYLKTRDAKLHDSLNT